MSAKKKSTPKKKRQCWAWWNNSTGESGFAPSEGRIPQIRAEYQRPFDDEDTARDFLEAWTLSLVRKTRY